MNLPINSLNHSDAACQYPEALYYGKRISQGGGQPVFKKLLPDGAPVKLCPGPSQKLNEHSQDGFQWGRTGSAPAQLSLALLLDATTDEEAALAYYQQFIEDKVARWGEEWSITRSEILEWIELQMKQQLEAMASQQQN